LKEPPKEEVRKELKQLISIIAVVIGKGGCFHIRKGVDHDSAEIDNNVSGKKTVTVKRKDGRYCSGKKCLYERRSEGENGIMQYIGFTSAVPERRWRRGEVNITI